MSVLDNVLTGRGRHRRASWLEQALGLIRRIKPDWVILRGWGVMNPVAIKTAQKVGYPVDHVIGSIWSNSAQEVRPAGAAAKGFLAITTHPSGTAFPVLQGIERDVVAKGQSGLADPKRFGTFHCNLGVVNGILNVEALRLAQAKYGDRPLSGEQVRWGFEHLKLDDARLQALGAKGLVQPLRLSCADHEGDGAIRYAERDLAGQSADAQVRVGVVQVLEGRHCFGRLSVEENLLSGGFVRRLGRAAQREERERLYAWFPRLAGKRRQLAGLASGGERQMMVLGRALLARPRLLLDEPSMGLAPLLVDEIFESVARLNREEGLSVLTAEQNSAIALDYAHQAFVLESGRVVQCGVPGSSLTREAVPAAYPGVG